MKTNPSIEKWSLLPGYDSCKNQKNRELINTCVWSSPTRINTSQHKSNTNQHESTQVQNKSKTSNDFPEAAARGVVCKKVFLEISQNS